MRKVPRIISDTGGAANNILEELRSHELATVGTIGEHNLPQLTAVYYQIDDDFVISFATKTATRKHQNIQKDNRVELLVVEEAKQLTIQIIGEAYEIADADLRETTVEYVYAQASKNDYQAPPISKLYAGEYVAYQVLPKRISMALYLRPQVGGYDMFEVINFGKN